jgi:hypothetical protein
MGDISKCRRGRRHRDKQHGDHRPQVRALELELRSESGPGMAWPAALLISQMMIAMLTPKAIRVRRMAWPAVMMLQVKLQIAIVLHSPISQRRGKRKSVRAREARPSDRSVRDPACRRWGSPLRGGGASGPGGGEADPIDESRGGERVASQATQCIRFSRAEPEPVDITIGYVNPEGTRSGPARARVQ